MSNPIKLQHGCGGKPTSKLIEEVFYKSFDNQILLEKCDSALLQFSQQKLAFTTDSFIIKPLFFQGGDIGKLAICGTVNDLAVCGARPLYLSCGFIIEEGFEIESLKKIAESMGKTAEELGVKIVTGDTKVVEKGNADGIYINTSGIGAIINDYTHKQIEDGDAIIVSGGIGEHGTLVALNRYNINFNSKLQSDCASIFHIVQHLQSHFEHIKLMKDPTRGGVATIINEMAAAAHIGARILDKQLPVKDEVKAVCSMLGMEPLYLACEGRLLLVVAGDKAEEILHTMRMLECCREAEIVGYFEVNNSQLVYIENEFGSKRIVPALEGDLLPRIC
ncbi:MAG: hydrogenase expression/formation protein HypE [Clostridia bacterium]|jgi:hydrogenase expression/formation protein HypE|nr:hydrogenase expression/formation protein HypE [Clostridia bacterium]